MVWGRIRKLLVTTITAAACLYSLYSAVMFNRDYLPGISVPCLRMPEDDNIYSFIGICPVNEFLEVDISELRKERAFLDSRVIETQSRTLDELTQDALYMQEILIEQLGYRDFPDLEIRSNEYSYGSLGFYRFWNNTIMLANGDGTLLAHELCHQYFMNETYAQLMGWEITLHYIYDSARRGDQQTADQYMAWLARDMRSKWRKTINYISGGDYSGDPRYDVFPVLILKSFTGELNYTPSLMDQFSRGPPDDLRIEFPYLYQFILNLQN